MKRRYRVIDPTTFEPTGQIVEIEDRPSVLFLFELSRVGQARKIDLGRAIESSQDESVSRGAFSSGEHPKDRRA